MIRIFLLFLCVSSTFFLVAQQSKIDSLTQVLKKAKEDTNKVKILNEVVSMYFTDHQKALPFAEEAKLLCEKLLYKKGATAAVAYGNLGTVYAYFGIYEKAFDNFLNELKVWDALNDTDMIIHSNNQIS